MSSGRDPAGQTPAISLRRATADDADLLLGWANEPAARAASLHTDPIERPTHLAWLASRLASPRCRIWIGADQRGDEIGVVRFELEDDGRAAVSISIAAAARGRGRGRELLAAGIVAARSDLRPAGFRARIRPDNARSIALFRAAGFRPGQPPAGSAPPEAVVELLLD